MVAQMDTTEIVRIGNIDQSIWLKSENTEKPILLFLHGGPGRTVMNSADNFNDELIKNFILVHWDQRETGKTLELNGTDEPLSVGLLQNDTYEMIQYLLKKFDRKKLYLISHSWSSFLGMHIAEKHPELRHAYIPISPMIDQEASTTLTIDMLKKWAKKNDNKIALQELDSVHIPLETKEDLFLQQKWLFIHNEVGFASEPDFRDIYFEWMDVWFPMILESFENSLLEGKHQIDCPIYFIEGNGDGQKSHQLVKIFYRKLKAKKKKFYWFKKSGHTVFNSEPDKLQEVIIQIAELNTPQ
jgi:pimeloyl-ACP methyl ester carboxylesterase